ncbi:GtrA family protein [Falsiroseomonas tokyonensis]|uniref:GtrA family protein n=1 Tax=Falsiroseomonas tokyonensis TaxID=430521 RepID=A0ABV7C0Z1_9PROT|nr:GtrA family protein [Falsiroseomonas tokyonensis]MBU8541463.1 GtrA family protein [Falsiroseomonas tokyonensis]
MNRTAWGLLRGLPQPVRFLLAGGGAAAVNWLVRFPLSAVMPFLAAVLVAAVIGMLVGFVLYRGFVFPASARPVLLQARDFFLVNLLTSGLVALLALLFVALAVRFGMGTVLAEAVAHAGAIAAGALLNYLGHSLVTFGPRGAGMRAWHRV